jgi:hypothetical protein
VVIDIDCIGKCYSNFDTIVSFDYKTLI